MNTMVKMLKRSGLKEWDDDKASNIIYGKDYDELDEDEKADLECTYWDFNGCLGN